MNNLRYIERDGKKVLQELISCIDGANGTVSRSWHDVPLAKDNTEQVNKPVPNHPFDMSSIWWVHVPSKEANAKAIHDILQKKLGQINKQREAYSKLKDVVESIQTPKECNCIKCQADKKIKEVKQFIYKDTFDKLTEWLKKTDKTVYGDIKQATVWLKDSKVVSRVKYKSRFKEKHLYLDGSRIRISIYDHLGIYENQWIPTVDDLLATDYYIVKD